MTNATNRPAAMPAPVVTEVNAGMWTAAAAGRLDVQRCRACGAHRYPPSDGCFACTSRAWEWSTLPGTGIVYTYVWIPDRVRSAQLGRDVLTNVTIVELDGTDGDPVRITTNVLDAWEPGDLEVGQRVELECVTLADEVGLPCFRLAREP